MKKRKALKTLLIILILAFCLLAAAEVFLRQYRVYEKEKERKEQAIAALEQVPRITPTPVPTATPTPTPEPTATPTPTPVIERGPAFDPEDYLYGTWYSPDGRASVEIYELDEDSVSFRFVQYNKRGNSSEADVTAEVAGNAANISFKDSLGNKAKGYLTFDNGRLYVKITTKKKAEGVKVKPSVDCIMTREG